MKIRALVSGYVTMEVDTSDIDKGCDMIRSAVKEDSSLLEWESPSVDYPSVEDSPTSEYSDRDFSDCLEAF